MNKHNLNKLIIQALREDTTSHDITTRLLVPLSKVSDGYIVSQENAVLCGLDIAKRVFQKLDRRVRVLTTFKDGMRIKRNTKIARLKGPTRALLTGERTALNFLGYLSGIATNTQSYVSKTRGTKAKIFDTRKTTPNLRALEKYAVQCGGGVNHRPDLSAHILIKDNHRASTRSSIPQIIMAVKKKTRKTLEIEVDNLSQLRQALAANPDIVLLDNMSKTQLKKAVAFTKTLPRKVRPQLEASGGITLNNVAHVAKTGVDRISIGALTHTHRAINFSMEFIN